MASPSGSSLQCSKPLEVPDHLVNAPGGSWALWRSMVLRGTGFPASRVLELAVPSLDDGIYRLLDLESEMETLRRELLVGVNAALDALRHQGRWDEKDKRRPLMKALQALTKGKIPKVGWDEGSLGRIEALSRLHDTVDAVASELGQIYEEGVRQCSHALSGIAGWKRFREAVVWQNREVVHTALRELSKPSDQTSGRNSRQRQHEELVANYLQRYCLKNDTIGFFGPVGWASLVSDGEAISVRVGADLVAHRQVYFENWCIDALAKKFSREPALRPWMIVRLKSCHYAEGSVLYSPAGAPVLLTPTTARLFAAMDGERTARDIAEDLVADPGIDVQSVEQVYRQLQVLLKKRYITWGMEVPLELHPERTLSRLLGHIVPEELRDEAAAPLEELKAGRRRVAAAAGDPEALDASLQSLEQTFVRVTGQDSRRHHGKTYAGRGLVYEDCRRDVDVRLGPDFLHRLGPPLNLVLLGARWLVGKLYREVESRLEEEYHELCRRDGARTLDSFPFYVQALSSIFLKRDPDGAIKRSEEEYQARWAAVLGLETEGSDKSHVRTTAADLRNRVHEAFSDPGPTWRLARHLSPDVMLAAAGEEAIRRGEMDIVLGEIHTSNTMFSSCFVSQHPDPEQLFSNLKRDIILQPVVVPLFIKESWMQRVNPCIAVPDFHRYDYADSVPGSTVECRSLPAAGLVVEEVESGLEACSRDGKLRFPAIELFGASLNQECSAIISHILPPACHWPRISIDQVVVSRESWLFPVAELDFSLLLDPFQRFIAVRRWAHAHRIPRFSFYKVSSEKKPCYLDLASPIYVDIMAKLIRGTAESGGEGTLALSEMLPRIDETWLSDAEGHRYTSELRMAALDLREGQL